MKATVIRVEHVQQKEVLADYQKKLNEFLTTPVDGKIPRWDSSLRASTIQRRRADYGPSARWTRTSRRRFSGSSSPNHSPGQSSGPWYRSFPRSYAEREPIRGHIGAGASRAAWWYTARMPVLRWHAQPFTSMRTAFAFLPGQVGRTSSPKPVGTCDKPPTPLVACART